MWISLLYLGTVLAVPMDEFRAIVHEGDLSMNDDILLKQIVPSGYTPQIINENTDLRIINIDDKDNENFKTFLSYVEKGVTAKGLIFNVYDDDMRNAAIALFRLLRDTRIYNRVDYERLKKWSSANINDDMFDYAKRLTALYSSSRGSEEKFLPPFIFKPNYFINGETIMRAMFMKNNNGKISESVLNNYQVYELGDKMAINTNYSGWNIPLNGCDEQISYFKDDVALNSYYYGVHLMHPFWMSNEELDEINPKHAEHFYYKHQQLFARYRLEKEHLEHKMEIKSSKKNCEPEYNPYLYYDNGLAFPTRSSILGDMQDDVARLKSIDIAIKECIYRGLVFMNGTFIKVSSDNYINLMTKLIRANLDGVKSAKIVRSIFGYGNNGFPVNRTNPTPSLLHHPQTTLRDPVYWFLMERGLDYFQEYTNKSEPINITKYETDEFNIIDLESPKLATTFEFSLINLNRAIEGDQSRFMASQNNIYARQRRLNHLPFTLNFTVSSKAAKVVIVRIFLGPYCDESCWDSRSRFFELDCYAHTLKEGLNIISWDPEKSVKYVSYNEKDFEDKTDKSYNTYKFPRNLVLPKGSESGLNLTLFIMITEDDSLTEADVTLNPILYHKFMNEIDNKPLGFPFHKQSEFSGESGPNYKFFNITVYHTKTLNVDNDGYFSPQLY